MAAHGSMAAVAAMLLLLRADTGTALLPGCPIYQLLHVRCPGCGATRALAALLHARWTEAWSFNPLLVATLPVISSYGLAAYARALGYVSWETPRMRPAAIWTGVALAAAFTLARNLPA